MLSTIANACYAGPIDASRRGVLSTATTGATVQSLRLAPNSRPEEIPVETGVRRYCQPTDMAHGARVVFEVTEKLDESILS